MKYIDNKIVYEIDDWVTLINSEQSWNSQMSEILKEHRTVQITAVLGYGPNVRIEFKGGDIWKWTVTDGHFRLATQKEIDEVSNIEQYKIGDWVTEVSGNEHMGVKIGITGQISQFTEAKTLGRYYFHLKQYPMCSSCSHNPIHYRLATEKEIRQQKIRDTYPKGTYIYVEDDGANDTCSEFYTKPIYKGDVLKVDMIVLGSDLKHLIAVGAKGEAIHLEEMPHYFRKATDKEIASMDCIRIGSYMVDSASLHFDKINVGCITIAKEKFIEIGKRAGWI